MQKLTLIVLVLLFVFPARELRADGTPTPPIRYMTLKDRRASDPAIVSIVPYPPKDPAQARADRDLVVTQTSFFLEHLYAHLKLKERIFRADPLDQIAQLLNRENDLNEEQFQLAMSKAFLDLNDLHTNYYFPKPYRCFSNTLPFSVDRVKNPDTRKLDQVAISAITKSKDILALSPGIEQLAPGDVIESYEGQDPLMAANALEELGAGANPDARVRRAVERLALRPQKLDPLPAVNPAHPDQIEVVVRKLDGSKKLTLQFPWISYYPDPTCLGLPPDPPGFVDAKASQAQGSNDFELEYSRLFRRGGWNGARPAKSDGNMDLNNTVNTAEPILHYKVLKNKRGLTFGYIRLDSFAPNKPMNDVVELVKGLLSNEFAATAGVVVDLRNNGGGLISFGEKLIQLFTPKEVVPENFTLRATLENLEYLKAAEPIGWFDPIFEKLVFESREKNPIPDQTAGAPLTKPQDANAVGEAYFKPVAVLANSSCFSTCDMFSAGMQDHGAAEIWMEDQRTGGGGANVLAGIDFLNSLPKNDHLNFIQLPNGQDFRIAWRQAVRVLKHEGELLEDVGVRADHFRDLPSSAEDLSLSSQLTMQTITDSLARRAPFYVASAYVPGGDHPDLPKGASLKLAIRASGANEIEVWQNGKHVSTQTVRPSRVLKSYDVAVPTGELKSNVGRVTLVGKLLGLPVWRKVVDYRLVPEPVKLDQPLDVALNGALPQGMDIFTRGGSRGWRIESGALVLGQNGQYDNNVDSDASLFVAVPAGKSLKITFDGQVDSESNFDFFTVYAVIDGKVTPIAGPLSGSQAQTYTADVGSSAVGRTIELRFEFRSDEAVVDKGVTIRNLRVF